MGECADGHEAVEAIRSLGPDLVFLDVQMPYDRALVYLAVAVAVMLVGPGRSSLDAMLFKRKDRVVEEKKEWLKIPAA